MIIKQEGKEITDEHRFGFTVNICRVSVWVLGADAILYEIVTALLKAAELP